MRTNWWVPIAALVLTLLLSAECTAWWACGHHIVAVMAYEELRPQEREQLIQILKKHPRFDQDFKLPKGVRDEDRYWIGHAGYWPDVARDFEKWNRPTWHYQLGSSLSIGQVKLPKDPGLLPNDATLETQELYIKQAVTLCRNVLANHTETDANRAVAICWLAHLVGDAHQPCHGGSLYVERLFPDGDCGANSIPTKQQENLHALWDSLLGSRIDEGDVARRIKEIRANERGWVEAKLELRNKNATDPSKWIRESQTLGREYVYTTGVLNAVRAARRSGAKNVERVDLSPEYLKRAGGLAQRRAAFAAHRLAAVWRECL